MAKSIGIVASATHRIALDYFKKFDSMMKQGRIEVVAQEMWRS